MVDDGESMALWFDLVDILLIDLGKPVLPKSLEVLKIRRKTRTSQVQPHQNPSGTMEIYGKTIGK